MTGGRPMRRAPSPCCMSSIHTPLPGHRPDPRRMAPGRRIRAICPMLSEALGRRRRQGSGRGERADGLHRFPLPLTSAPMRITAALAVRAAGGREWRPSKSLPRRTSPRPSSSVWSTRGSFSPGCGPCAGLPTAATGRPPSRYGPPTSDPRRPCGRSMRSSPGSGTSGKRYATRAPPSPLAPPRARDSPRGEPSAPPAAPAPPSRPVRAARRRPRGGLALRPSAGGLNPGNPGQWLA